MWRMNAKYARDTVDPESRAVMLTDLIADLDRILAEKDEKRPVQPIVVKPCGTAPGLTNIYGAGGKPLEEPKVMESAITTWSDKGLRAYIRELWLKRKTC